MEINYYAIPKLTKVKKGVVNFLFNSIIYDEDGKEISFSEFWQMVENNKFTKTLTGTEIIDNLYFAK